MLFVECGYALLTVIPGAAVYASSGLRRRLREQEARVVVRDKQLAERDETIDKIHRTWVCNEPFLRFYERIHLRNCEGYLILFFLYRRLNGILYELNKNLVVVHLVM